ncbi:MAG TPA: FixH family protein, partial [Chthonomonadales bacterium]|nr:FixH family protein [Chthonomonadales bacterium]
MISWNFSRLSWLAAAALLLPSAANADPVRINAGPYHVQMVVQPSPIPVGPADLIFEVRDTGGNPVSGAKVSALAQMPGMPMGESNEAASPVPDKPGQYRAPARFGMAGAYGVTLNVSGRLGAATGKATVQTGQDTGTLGGASAQYRIPWILLAWLAIGAALAFVAYRMNKTKQSVDLRRML